MTLRGTRGQSLVELAVALPLILVMLAGLYVACRTAFLMSAAHSAAQAEALRAGRTLPGIERQLAATLLPGETGASVSSQSGRTTRLLPTPFPPLTGRSSGVVSVDKQWSETAGIGGFDPLSVVVRVDLSADCWNGSSRSGKTIRRAILARVALGAIR
ncbi:MAG: hypothetical protein ACM3NF_06480 [Gemmatimonadota bacterium]